MRARLHAACVEVTQHMHTVITTTKKLTFPLNTLIGTTFPWKSLTVKEWKSVHSMTLALKPMNRTTAKCQNSISWKFPSHDCPFCEETRTQYDVATTTSKRSAISCFQLSRWWPITASVMVIDQSETSKETSASFQSARSARVSRKVKFIRTSSLWGEVIPRFSLQDVAF